MKKETVEKLQGIAIASLLVFIVLTTISIFRSDCRYVGTGIIFFGVFYCGSAGRIMLSIPFYITGIAMILLAIAITIGGVGIFLHHYDVDGIFDFYVKIAKIIDEYGK